VALRVVQGSATVALTTTGGLIAPVVEVTEGLRNPDLALIVIAIAGGSTVLSHVNDSGFWLVGRSSTWTSARPCGRGRSWRPSSGRAASPARWCSA
jgi:H+/gluconate symporter-like permease